MTAARTGKPEPVEALLEAGAGINTKNAAGQNALMWASAEGHAAVVRQLLPPGPSAMPDWAPGSRLGSLPPGRDDRPSPRPSWNRAWTSTRPWRRRTPTGAATRTKGTTALILAVENGHFELAVRLLVAGADPNDQRSGFTPLHVLTWVRKPKRGDNIDGAPPPWTSGKITSLQMARALIDHGAEVNARLERGPSGSNRLGRPGINPLPPRRPHRRRPPHEVSGQARGRFPASRMRRAAPRSWPPPGSPSARKWTRPPTRPRPWPPSITFSISVPTSRSSTREGETVMHAAAYKQAPNLVKLLDERGADIEVLEYQQPARLDPAPDCPRVPPRKLQTLRAHHSPPSSK